jgi:hypothetical protein
MAPSPEIQARIDLLKGELEATIKSCGPRAKGGYWTSIILMIIAVGASIVGGIGGLSNQFSPQVTGLLALIPGAIALLVSNLKFQDKSNWHYRRMGGLIALRSRLLLQLPEAPTADHVAAIAKERDAMGERFHKEWEEKFSLNFAAFEQRKSDNAIPPPSPNG